MLRRLNAGKILADVGWQATLVVGIWGQAAFVLGGDAGSLAGVTASMTSGWLLGAGAAGHAIDRFGPKRVMIACQILIAPTVLLMQRVPSTGALLGLVGLLSLLVGPSHLAVASMAPHLSTERRDFQRINGSLEVAGTVATIIGAATGALIARSAGVSWIFVFHSGLALASAVVVGGIETTTPAPPDRARRGLFDGGRRVYSDPALVKCLAASMSVWMTMSVFETLQPLFVRDRLGAGADALGWLHIIFAVGLVAGSAVTSTVETVTPRSLPVWMATLGVGIVIFASDGLVGALVGLFVIGLSLGGFEPLLRTAIQSRVERPRIGRVLSTLEIHDQVAELTPLLVLATATAALGVPVVLVTGGVGVVAVGLLAGGIARRARA